MNAHNKGEKIVVPVRLRSCPWEGLPIHSLHNTPTSAWITSGKNKDEIWTEVAHDLLPLVEKVKERKLKERGQR